MKIRCGSHQQNRSIVRPGLSLMATKVALTAEEFRENSQRSIALFNTEKLSTNSTHVLKSAYAFCAFLPLQSARSVWRQSSCIIARKSSSKAAICTERVEAKAHHVHCLCAHTGCCNLHGACGGKADDCQFVHCFSYCNLHGACGDKAKSYSCFFSFRIVAICTEHVGAKRNGFPTVPASFCCNLHAACGGKRVVVDIHRIISYGCNLPPKKI